MKKKIVSLSVLMILIFLAACDKDGLWYNHKWEKMHPYGQNLGPAACGDTTTVVSYSVNIQSIINSNCAVSTCHDGSGACVPYTSMANVAADANAAPPNDIMTRVKMTPGATGFMPQGGSSLPVCDIEKIRLWIKGGCKP